ncbi:MAG: hypothetical protein FJ387_31605 [Verrucomicrobia bacterium]|nr:hypothetical protein [Verrucomicrobiota bacterium]
MNMKFPVLLAGVTLLALAAGCYQTVEGRAKAGMPFSKDRIEGRYEFPADQVFAAAREVVKFNGTLTGDNTVTRTVTGKMDNNTVWVRVDEMEPGISRVLVQSRRKGGRGNVDVASEIDKQIALYLQSNFMGGAPAPLR